MTRRVVQKLVQKKFALCFWPLKVLKVHNYRHSVYRPGGFGNCSGKSLPTFQELSGTPNPWYFSKVSPVQMGGVPPVQIGGVLQYKLEVYCGVSFSPKLRSQRGTALQMGGVGEYCGTNWRCTTSTFQTRCTGWGFLYKQSPTLARKSLFR